MFPSDGLRSCYLLGVGVQDLVDVLLPDQNVGQHWTVSDRYVSVSDIFTTSV